MVHNTWRLPDGRRIAERFNLPDNANWMCSRPIAGYAGSEGVTQQPPFSRRTILG